MLACPPGPPPIGDGTVSRFGEGGSSSSLSCLRKKGGVEKNPPPLPRGSGVGIGGRSPEGEGRSKEDCAVVAADVDAEVSEM
jgi:hypothetical protein